MTPVDWWWIGRNNATDGDYWPPRAVGIVRGACYRIGWIVGKVYPNPRTHE